MKRVEEADNPALVCTSYPALVCTSYLPGTTRYHTTLATPPYTVTAGLLHRCQHGGPGSETEVKDTSGQYPGFPFFTKWSKWSFLVILVTVLRGMSAGKTGPVREERTEDWIADG